MGFYFKELGIVVASFLSFAIATNLPLTDEGSQNVLPNETPVVYLDADKAFELLTPKEQFYAHHLSRASFFGGLAVLLQTSPESPQIFRLLQRINRAQSLNDLQNVVAPKAGFTEDDFKSYLVYNSGVLANMGNYVSFGDSKIIPNITLDKFEAFVWASKAYEEDAETIIEIWEDVKKRMYSISPRQKQLGLGEKGVTKYLSDNITQEDSDRIDRFFKEKGLEGWNNRAFKTTNDDGKTVYEIRNAGAVEKLISSEEFEGSLFNVTSGDYAGIMEMINDNLAKAMTYTANDEETLMIYDYVQSFRNGDLDAHKDGSRHWISNKSPNVETYIGFIENYRDPAGIRSEFEGFVAMVNKEQSVKFQTLVKHAEEILPRLPWPKEFEKDVFLKPDFTSLDVLTFAGSGIPKGINIPNYNEIRQNDGFKNVNLGNGVGSSNYGDKSVTFLSEEDSKLYKDLNTPSYEVKVGLHELLGHGSGKLLITEADGSKNFVEGLLNPVTGEPIEVTYKDGDTFDNVFSSIGSSYEECKAESVALYLSTYKDIFEIFELGEKYEDARYILWLNMMRSAVKGVERFSPDSREWKQAHSRARFAIMQVLMEAGEGFLTVTETKNEEDGKPDLLISMDRSKLESVGKPAIAAYLQKLQVYKSLGDIEKAKEMYEKYSNVDDKWIKWRDIVIARKSPRKLKVQANTRIEDGKVKLTPYESSHLGMAQSWIDRFTDEEFTKVDGILYDLFKLDEPHFQNTA